MPMVYVSERTLELIELVFEHLRKNIDAPSRVVKADVIHIAIDEYARKLGLKEK
ncbi:MAG: hypothetical protein OEZ35_02815 [Candidatus Bathyarchaeota archaeon]|nr:hypothetical protein [Candidatus Bathyarchaeota archaeon]